jgi:hypothetical protein
VKKPGIEASISPVYVVPSAGIEPATKRLEGSCFKPLIPHQ